MNASASSHGMMLRALARLLVYPDTEMIAHLDDLRTCLHHASPDPVVLQELDVLLTWLRDIPLLDVQAAYVSLFDQGRQTSLHLFEHVHGDARSRGPAMIDLTQTYEQAGLLLRPDELPDYLPVVLEYTSMLAPEASLAFLHETAHILNALHTALAQRETPYAAVLAALLQWIGVVEETVQLEAEPALDQTWAEPEVFGAVCSPTTIPGQAAQPVHIVRRAADAGHGQPAGV